MKAINSGIWVDSKYLTVTTAVNNYMFFFQFSELTLTLIFGDLLPHSLQKKLAAVARTRRLHSRSSTSPRRFRIFACFVDLGLSHLTRATVSVILSHRHSLLTLIVILTVPCTALCL